MGIQPDGKTNNYRDVEMVRSSANPVEVILDRMLYGRMKSIPEHGSLVADRTTVIVECGSDDDLITRSAIDRRVAKMNLPVMLCRVTLTMEGS